MKWWQADEWAKGPPITYPRKEGKQARIRGEFHEDGTPVRVYIGSLLWAPRV